jgi:TetR/AcrR family transcriptional regulator
MFAERGLTGARTDAIARAAGVNKALLYYYFRSKDALYLAVVEEHLKEFYLRAQEVLESGGSVRRTLLSYVAMHFDRMSRQPKLPLLFQRFILSGGRGVERLARKYSLPLMRRLSALIRHGVRNGELRPVDVRQAVISIVGLTVHYFSVAPLVRALGRGEPYSKKSLARRRQEILDFVRFGLFRHPEEVE